MKRLVYLLIPIMVMLVACCNKSTIDFTNQEAVCKAWSDWDNQNSANKDALVKNAIEMINGKNAERAVCQAKKDSVAAIIDAKWTEVETSTDVEAQKALIDEIHAICKENCCKKCCKDGEKKCSKDGEKKECCKDGEKKECCKEKAECCQAWADWANLKSDKKTELIQAAIEKHNACKAKCEEKKAECATKQAEFDAKWATISNLDIEAQKALIDEIFAACPSKCCKDSEKCCKKDGEKKCCKEKAEETKE